MVWAAIEQADINAQRNYANGKSWLCQKWVGLRVKFEEDPGGGPNGEDLPELSGEITGVEWRVDHEPPCYAAVSTPDDDDDAEPE